MLLTSKSLPKAQLSALTPVSRRFFGNFELFHPIPPRYFLVRYELDQRQLREKILDAAGGAEVAINHREKVQKAVDMQKILFRGEMLPQRAEEGEADGEAASEAKSVAEASDLDQIIFVFNARDEREPHEFIMKDPLHIEGIVKEWNIQELDLIHKERDDELTITGKF